MESTRRLRQVAACCLFAFAVLVYLPSLACGFVDFDDLDYLHTNTLVVRPGWHTITSPGPANHADFLPVTMSLYAVQWALFGSSPLPFHLTNVLLHAGATVLLFLLVAKLLPDLPLGLAVAAAALFAAHPMNTEAVTWVSETKSVLCMCLALAAFLAWIRWRESGSAWAWAGSLALHGLSLGAKTASVTFPVAFVLSDLWLRRKEPLARAIVPVLPHLALSAIALLVRVQLQSASTQETMLSLFSGPGDRIATVFDVFAWNLRCFAGGSEQNIVHALHIARSFLEPAVIAGALLAAAAVAGSVLLSRRRPAVAFGLMWFVVIGLPTAQIIPLPPVLRADRYLYFSGIGLLIALAAVTGDLARHRGTLRVAVALLLGTAALWAVSSVRRQQVWKDSKTLWTDSVAKAPGNDLSRRALGRVLLQEGDVDGALAQYRKALELDPGLMVNLEDLGSALVLAGRMADAIPLFEKSVALFPRSIKAWSSLGHCRLVGRGDAEGALACFVKAAELDPSDPEPLEQAATCFTRLGRRDVARAWSERAEQLRQARAAPAR